MPGPILQRHQSISRAPEQLHSPDSAQHLTFLGLGSTGTWSRLSFWLSSRCSLERNLQFFEEMDLATFEIYIL
jgi:hypothetical protein